MASDLREIDAAPAERERVLRILREQAPRLRTRDITRLSLFGCGLHLAQAWPA